jgi:hypothetical protein
MPFFFEAAILSRIRSAVTSRSNWALELGEGQQHVERQPAHRGGGVEGLGHRDEGGARCVEDGDDAGEVGERAGQPVDLVDHDDVDGAGLDIREQLPQGGPVHRPAGEAAIVIVLRQCGPALMLLAGDIGRAGLALGVERVELLLQTFFGRLAGVDRAADDHPGSGLAHDPLPLSRKPKKAGPLRRDPVMARAMAESEAWVLPRQM